MFGMYVHKVAEEIRKNFPKAIVSNVRMTFLKCPYLVFKFKEITPGILMLS